VSDGLEIEKKRKKRAKRCEVDSKLPQMSVGTFWAEEKKAP